AEITTAPAEITTAPAEITTAPAEITTAQPEVTTAEPEVTTESLSYPPCPSNLPLVGRYPNIESNCRSYYECDKGVVLPKDCPPGLLFDIWTNMCQLEKLVPSCRLV
ncbi:chitin binding domain-containing protein, partial [Campylobacter fetus subsp. venerealis]|nr:chitin binding domain-containing protein [Campylobacter fetus subsp. venerealis]